MFTSSDQMMFQCTSRPPSLPMEIRKWKSHVEFAPNCPRCASSNTKFCYYNNYSLSQPRYFCKGCRRYWTKGGSLRNVPVGGGCRKARRVKSSVRVSRKNFSGSNRITTNDESSCSSISQESGTSGPDIDLAVVFAKFLNQDSSSCHHHQKQDQFPPNSLINNDRECKNQMDPLIQECDGFLEGSLPPAEAAGHKQQEDQETIQRLMEIQEMDAFGLQTLMGDEVVQDAFWSEESTATLPDFTWQPQEFDVYGWSSLDLSGFEVLSRP